MIDTFSAPEEKVPVVPNGVEPIFLNTAPVSRASWLVCTATITARNRVLELAEAGVLAKTPIWFIGKPYGEDDLYARRFLETARKNPQTVRYEGAIENRDKLAQAYREARGFVLLSTWESLSLSALEAVASACPLLLSDLPWAHCVFGQSVLYCSTRANTHMTARVLRHFYEQASTLPPPPRPASWEDVARQLMSIYQAALNSLW